MPPKLEMKSNQVIFGDLSNSAKCIMSANSGNKYEATMYVEV